MTDLLIRLIGALIVLGGLGIAWRIRRKKPAKPAPRDPLREHQQEAIRGAKLRREAMNGPTKTIAVHDSKEIPF